RRNAAWSSAFDRVDAPSTGSLSLPRMDSVLVIDDEKNIRALLGKVLGQDQVEVYSAGTAAEGLQMADEHEPDLVLVDLRLPDTSGLEVLRALKARHPEAIVIMMNAFGQVESAVEAM